MTLSFLYRAFWHVLQLIRLVARKDTDLAIEVVVLRHEVAVGASAAGLPANCMQDEPGGAFRDAWPTGG